MSNTNNSLQQTASSAAGAGLVCPRTQISTSKSEACQTPAPPSEPDAHLSHYVSRDGDPVLSRRTIMNMMIGTAIAGAAISSNPNQAGAAPLTTDRRALEAYASWLHMERRLICLELYPHMGRHAEKFVFGGNAGFDWHFSGRGDLNWDEGPQPSSRAATILDLVGVDWRNYAPPVDHHDTGVRQILPVNWPETDGELRQAFQDLIKADSDIDRIHDEYGDEADSREDYAATNDKRNDSIYALSTVAASSMVGIQAKAAALRLRRTFEDFVSHQDIAVSLAEDLASLNPGLFPIESETVTSS